MKKKGNGNHIPFFYLKIRAGFTTGGISSFTADFLRVNPGNRVVQSCLFSLVLWQITSIEKLNASAKAREIHISWRIIPIIIIVKQNILVITVSAFFSVKYLLKKESSAGISFFISRKVKSPGRKIRGVV